ncbi:Cucumisin [Morella rubra]|uniref:Cucumisin n=1 Tax=Morella rubra TaxID=262757 RepID=A0A6A1VXU8_9ROSI|nr:Cucumisin [Morella rubra]
MESRSTSSLSWLLLLSLVSTLLIGCSTSLSDRKTYIVYMGDRQGDEVSTSSLHTSMLQEVIDRKGWRSIRVPQRTEKAPHNKVMGLPWLSTASKCKAVESDIVIGVLDSGIWPESDSFNDKGFGPPPSKWKGKCQASTNFTCNKCRVHMHTRPRIQRVKSSTDKCCNLCSKIIGAQYYRAEEFISGDIKSPRDSDGHGTHTASTAAGNAVSGASVLGLGFGTARGGVPSARIAVYKVCWSDSCYDADILAAFDDAIHDGVDIISISIGGSALNNYFEDSISIGAFHAMRNGILTSTSAGNRGPTLSTVTNYSPWSLSVAASAIDRKFFTEVQLGDNKIYEGISINTFDLKNEMYPMIYGGDAANKTADFASGSRYCFPDSLDKNLVKGKILLCDSLGGGDEAFFVGAVGVVMQARGRHDIAYPFALPASYVGSEDGGKIFLYMNSTRNSTGTILRTKERKEELAPFIPSFSSRGPNPATPNLLKPDLAAPGLNILAAWSPISPISGLKGDKRAFSYNVVSGTSMACPHATGVAGYIKSFHPTWSPAALKSALLTTAVPMSPEKNPEAEFAYGAGNINPLKAPHPGYSTKLLQVLTGDNGTCSEVNNGTASFDLNYPSFALSTSPSKSISHIFSRTVTNVGSAKSTYKATVTAPPGLAIKVNPSVLSFTCMGQKLPFELVIEGTINQFVVSASLTWDDGTFQVRSPIVVFAK